MQKASEERKGEFFILAHMVGVGVTPVIIALSYTTLVPLASLAWGVLVAGVLFGFVVLFRGLWRGFTKPKLFQYILGVSFFNVFLFHVLFFVGLQFTTAGNASIILLMEVFTSFVFFHLIRREFISREHVLGASLMVLGAGIVLLPNVSSLNIGDFLILGATIAPPLGNYFQRKARNIASSSTIMFLRYAVTAPFIFALAYFINAPLELTGSTAVLFIIFNGIIVFGISKVLFVESIHRISVTKAKSIDSLAPLLTLGLAWLVLHEVPTVWQLVSLIPFVIGIFLMTGQLNFGARRT